VWSERWAVLTDGDSQGDSPAFRPAERLQGNNDGFDGAQVDSLITAAARALAAGDPIGALNRIALREDASALALRGIAMAQLGQLDRAKSLLKRAARAFDPKESLARARCVIAEAEIALVSRCRWVSDIQSALSFSLL
jgi:hypothetical protein